MSTMLIGGIWHGASWMYLIWGGYNGALLVGHKAMKRHYCTPDRIKGTRVARVFNIALTFLLVTLGFIIFRATSLENLTEIFRSIATNFHPEIAWQFASGYTWVVVLMIAGFVFHFLPDRFYSRMLSTYNWMPLALQALILAMVIFLVIQARQSEIMPFIYLQY